jgi:hypothetical protein
MGRIAQQRRVIAALLAVMASLTSCGRERSATENGPLIVRAGAADIQLPDGYVVADPSQLATVAPASSVGAAGPAGPDGGSATSVDNSASANDSVADNSAANNSPSTSAPTNDTIPLNADTEGATSKLLKAVGKFNNCLDGEGFTFIGVPDAKNPATQDKAYIDGLTKCAAQSNVVQALQDSQKEADSLTPEQIKERNTQYLDWRDCMLDKGWKIPQPKPDEKGRLFTLGGGGTSTGFEPPAGTQVTDTSDFTDCIAEITRNN